VSRKCFIGGAPAYRAATPLQARSYARRAGEERKVDEPLAARSCDAAGEFVGLFRAMGLGSFQGITPDKDTAMAKGQKKSNKEIRKPKADKGPKQNASQPSLKPGGIKGLENMKNR
jgi:hypothetical protein